MNIRNRKPIEHASDALLQKFGMLYWHGMELA